MILFKININAATIRITPRHTLDLQIHFKGRKASFSHAFYQVAAEATAKER
jgi:hypothetical protein